MHFRKNHPWPECCLSSVCPTEKLASDNQQIGVELVGFQ